MPYQIITFVFERMRKRRGAIHSDDQQQFLKLSILSQKTMGIFYNDSPNPSSKSPPNPSPSQSSAWSKFDFNKEDRMRIQELQQEQQESGKRVISNTMIIPKLYKELQIQVKKSLNKILHLPSKENQSCEGLQLVIAESDKGNKVNKFWLRNGEYSSMLESYYRMSDTYLIVMDQEEGEGGKSVKEEIEIIKGVKGEEKYGVEVVVLENGVGEEGEKGGMQRFEKCIKGIME